MTTIVTKQGMIAYDGLASNGDYAIDTSYPKRFELDGVYFYLAGDASSTKLLAESYLEESLSMEADLDYPCELIVDDPRTNFFGLVAFSNMSGAVKKFPFRYENHYAIGSGAPFVLAALDAGATIKQAMDIACSRDTQSGGKITTVKVKSKFV